jgi:hypothetical protein
VSVWLQLMGLSCLVLCVAAVVTSDDRSGQTAMITLASNSSLDVMCMCVFLWSAIMFPWHRCYFPKAWVILYTLLNSTRSPESNDTQGKFENGFWFSGKHQSIHRQLRAYCEDGCLLDVTSCCPADFRWHFGGACRFSILMILYIESVGNNLLECMTSHHRRQYFFCSDPRENVLSQSTF